MAALPDADVEPAAAPAVPAPARGRARPNLSLFGGRVLVTVAVLALWELASRTVVDPFWVGRPTAIVAALVEWVRTGVLVTHLAPTLAETAIGFLFGGVAGVLLGFLLGYLRILDALLNPFVTAVYTLPKIALAPLVLLWFGIGFSAKAALSALLVFFLVFFNTHAGVREVDPDLIDAARLMGASRARLLRFVYLPHAAAWVFAGLRLSLPYALVGAVVGEMLAANRGIGYLLATAANQFDTVHAFAALGVLIALGLLLNAGVAAIEARVQRWQPQRLHRTEGW